MDSATVLHACHARGTLAIRGKGKNMTDFDNPRFRGVLSHPSIRQVADHWYHLRAAQMGQTPRAARYETAQGISFGAREMGNDLPASRMLDPRALAQALPQIILIENRAGDLARIKYAGSHISAIMGMELRSMPLRALFDMDDRPHLAQMLTPLFTGAMRGEMLLQATVAREAPPMIGALHLWPMMGPQGVVDRAVAVLTAEGAIGRPPRRFAIAAHRFVPIDRALEAEPPARPQLRVIMGGRRD